MRAYLLLAPLILALAAPQTGCGRSEAEVEALVRQEREKTEAALRQLEEARGSKEKLKKATCDLLCVQFEQLKSIGPFVGSGRQREYDSLLANLRSTLEALGCPSCQ